MIGFFSLFIIFNSVYSDLTIDLKGRVIFLSSEDRIVEDESNLVHFSIDSMFEPLSVSSSFFSVWVTSPSEFKSQKYSLWGELLGEIDLGGNDIDADEKRVLIAGEQSYLIQLITGTRIVEAKREMKRCLLSGDFFYLYGNDTLYAFKRDGKLNGKKCVPGVKDLFIYDRKLCFLFSDSLVLNDTVVTVAGGKRVSGSDRFVAVLTDSGVVYYPKKKK